MATAGLLWLRCSSVLSLVLVFWLAHGGRGHPVSDAKGEPETEHRLRAFNLTGLRPQGHRTPATPAEDMLELYERLAGERTAGPSATTVRSFRNQDSSHCSVSAEGIRRHPLLFNVSIPDYEQITGAELHLHAMMQEDLHLYAGQGRWVTIYEIRENGSRRMKDCGGGTGRGQSGELAELASRRVDTKDHAWKTFDLTAVVRRWCKSKHAPQRLEVHIASLAEPSSRTTAEETKSDGSTEAKHTSSLVVFSNDQSRKHSVQMHELNLMTGYINQQGNKDLRLQNFWGEDKQEEDEESVSQGHANVIYDTASRVRRNAQNSPCKRAPMYVDFKDIGWDSWILAPPGYEAYKCSGICSYPLLEHVTPTKHAMVQTLVNLKSPERASRACCVPTKLKPISLLYLDDTGVMTYKAKYESMVVAECGCR
ncbi:bone morphogenetic protein 10-like [Scleropages formosus]|uniref:bone morphogenetic protein 10-like n=1 Tax=Scleropages formosus TaxID=113540 RepID=UPI0010FABF62|nr:bone morphogenetic protein 10-like [Scleropages formosus]